jgi:lipopolysaccharide exporter
VGHSRDFGHRNSPGQKLCAVSHPPRLLAEPNCETAGLMEDAVKRENTARSVTWTLLSYGSNKTISVATTIVLAHLLVPRAFGLVAIALLVVSLLTVFNDVGLGAVLVAKQDLTQRAKGTILSVMIVVSLLLALLLAAAAPLVADLMRSPKLPPVLVAISAMLAMSGPVWFYESLLQRELAFRSGLISRLVQTLTYTVIAIVTAVLGAGVWSLVAGQISSTFFYLVALMLLTPYRVRPSLDLAAAKELLRQARGYVAQGALSFMQQNTDYVAVGRLLGDGALGIYSMAYRLGDLTYWGIVNPVAKVTFPTFARMRSRGEDVSWSYLSALRLVTLVACPIGVLLSATATPFTHLVFGHHWLSMIAPLTALGLWAALRPIETTATWLLNSVGHPGIVARIGVVLLIPLIPVIILAAQWGGITAVSWVVTGHILLSTAAMTTAVTRRLDVTLRAQWRTIRPIVIAGGLAWLAARRVSILIAGAPGVVWFGAAVLAGLVCYGGLLLVLAPEILREAAGRAGQVLRRAPETAVGVP